MPGRAAAEQGLSARTLRALSRPSAHPTDPSAARGVETLQTHLSVVFLTRERVYKFRKAVDLGFVCFRERAERNADCLREVSLNRRLAPDVYLGVAPLEWRGGRPRIGALRETLAAADAAGEVPEHCVVMRRLPAGRDALSLLEARRLAPAHVDAIADCIARFHGETGLGVPAPFSPEQWRARVTRPVFDNFRLLAEDAAGHVPRSSLARCEARARAFLERHGARLEGRRQEGRAVDGHGDLHLQHVWFEHEGAPPIAIDCLEFREDLRRIDAAADVAFLSMDLEYRGARRLAALFQRRYARARDDYGLYGVIDFYASYRAAVRAKVAAVAAADPGLGSGQRRGAAGSVRRHLALAARALAPRPTPALILVCGPVGTGKSSVAEVLADGLEGVVISSDRVRKHLAGLAPRSRAARAREGAGLYAEERKQAVYAGLLLRAEPVLASGRVAILDATFDRAARRTQARVFAAERGHPAFLIETRCGARQVLERLARRQREGRDPSDAGPERYAPSVAAFEPPREWPARARIVLRTDADWRGRLRAQARRLRARHPRK